MTMTAYGQVLAELLEQVDVLLDELTTLSRAVGFSSTPRLPWAICTIITTSPRSEYCTRPRQGSSVGYRG